MKYVSYIMIMVMLICLGSLFILKRPDGKAWLDVSDVVQKLSGTAKEALGQSNQTLKDVVDYAKGVSDNNNEDAKALSQPVIYKWQDAQGNWIYSDKPNPQGDSEKHTLDPRRITIMAAEDTSILEQIEEKKPSTQPSSGLPSALNPAAVEQLMKDAKHVQKLMDERNKALEEGTKGQ